MSNKYRICFKKIITLLLSVIIVFGILPFYSVNAENGNLKNEISLNGINYNCIAENAGLKFFADTKTADFIIQNKQTGKNWYSTPIDAATEEITIGATKTEMQSHLVIQYIYKEDELYSKASKITNSFIECQQTNNVSVELVKDGMKVKYNFADIGVVIPVIYTLSESYFTAEVDFKNIKIDKKVYLNAIELLPSFGANNSSKNGYLFVPDGTGALIDFNNGVDSEFYKSMIYGSELAIPVEKKTTQTETIRMPVFGIKDDNDGLFAIITKGDKNSSIIARNKNSTCGYNSISSEKTIRSLTQKTIYKNDPANRQDIGRVTKADNEGFAVRYYFLSGEKANYVGMASLYRDYLVNECGLTKKTLEPTFNLDIYGAIDKKASFLGIPYTAKVKLTTYSQAKTILKELKKVGIDNISVRYLGWTGDGLLNIKKLKKASPISLLGGKKGFNDLMDYAYKNSVNIYLNADLLEYRKGSKNQAIKTSFEQVSNQYHFMRSVYARDTKTTDVRLMSYKLLNKTAKKVLKPLYKNKENNISLSGVGSTLYSNFSERNFFSRSEAGKEITKTLASIGKNVNNVAVEGGNIFTVPYASKIYDIPSSSGNYDIFDEDVPFYQIVLHGFVSMTGVPFVQSTEPIDSFLKAVETGTELHYSGMYADSSVVTGTRYDNIYSSTYKLWLDTAAKQYVDYMPILKSVSDKTITAHKKISQDVYKTTFENGVQVIVNYSDKEYDYNGTKVAAKGFALLSKEGVI